LKAKRLFGWNVANSSESSSASSLPTSTNYRVVSTPSQSSLLSPCVQEIFASFITATLRIVDISNVATREESHGFRLANSLVSEIAELFTKCQVVSRDEAFLCILPPVMTRLRSPAKGLDGSKEKCDSASAARRLG